MESRIDKDIEPEITRESRSFYTRSDFFWGMVSIWIILPVVASLVFSYFDIDIGGIERRVKVSDGQVVGSGITFDLFSVWLLQIPLHIHSCYKRVMDTRLNKWFTVILCLPVFNLALLLWPSKKT